MRPCVTIEGFASIHLAVEAMREAGQELIPVTKDGKLQGVLTQNSIVKILGGDVDKDSATESFIESANKILNRTTGAEALRQLELNNTLVVVDDHDVVCGLLTPSCFIATPREPERPPMVGGMATPFGVYLTTGAVRGGKHGWYLYATGIFLVTFYGTGIAISSFVTRGFPDTWQTYLLVQCLSSAFMLCIFRLLPIAGYHAAEHQVVHAIERNEELTPEVIARMPRVHPRCGTNLAVGLTMFLTIGFTPWIPEEHLRVFIALFTTLYLWRSVGSFVQYWFTTKKPNRKQIDSGIAAGKELFENYATAPIRTSTPMSRILNSGILHVMAGSFTALGIFGLVMQLLFKIYFFGF